jgi:choline dehydrogenase
MDLQRQVNGLGGRHSITFSNVAPEYDYVVVGGGSAGCTLAARLSEDPTVTVLLLEAGGTDEVAEVRVPAGYTVLQRSSVDWRYRSTPQAGLNNRRLNWPRGKMLGGCSSMNFMAYVRGHRANFNQWRDELGCDGWGYEDCLPYFTKSEDCRLEGGGDGAPYRGIGGPLIVSQATETKGELQSLTQCFVAACAESGGLPLNRDYNGKHQVGASVTQGTYGAGERQSTSHAFLRGGGAGGNAAAAEQRPNLTIRTCAHVTRVLTQGTRAIGVEYAELPAGPSANPRTDEDILRGQPRRIVLAAREVYILPLDQKFCKVFRKPRPPYKTKTLS